MAISPFRRLSGMTVDQRHVSRYRRRILEGRIVQLAPVTEDVPLALAACNAPERTYPLQELLLDIPRIRITSPRAPERTQLLVQICREWASEELQLGLAKPLMITLPEARRTPEQAIADAMDDAGFPDDLMSVRRSLASGHWLLLLDGWDRLPAAAREQWRDWLVETVERYPGLPVVVATGPDDQARWNGLHGWELAQYAGALTRAA
jgi:hypothetical protein